MADKKSVHDKLILTKDYTDRSKDNIRQFEVRNMIRTEYMIFTVRRMGLGGGG